MRTTPRRNIPKQYNYRAISMRNKCYMYFKHIPEICKSNVCGWYWWEGHHFSLCDRTNVYGKPRKGTKFTTRTMTNSLRKLV